MAALLTPGCGSVPLAPAAPTVSYEQKMSWIFQLEDQRLLRIEAPPPPAAPVPRRGRAVPAPVAPSISPDLSVLVRDGDPRVRRRAALAIGRVGLGEGVGALLAVLTDPDPDVREMAAFAIGLVGVSVPQPQPVPAETGARLIGALADASPRVRGRAAEALGQLNLKDGAEPIGRMVAEFARHSAVVSMTPDDERWPLPPEADAFSLGLFALVRLRAYEPLAASVLDAGGQPVTTWWPAAYALQRIGDARAQSALRVLLRTPGTYTAAFAARGLGALKDTTAVDPLVALLLEAKTPREVAVAAIRALAQIGDLRGSGPLAGLLSRRSTDPHLRLEAVMALGVLKSVEGLPIIQDLLSDSWPAMRAAAMRAAASIEPENFLLVLASLDPDREWLVRAALADSLGGLPAEVAADRLRPMLSDDDRRVLPHVLGALVRLRVPDAAALVLAGLKDPDFALRAASARLVGDLKPAGGVGALVEAVAAAQSDSAYDARAAALTALAAYGAADALEPVKAALADKEWAIRLRAVELLNTLDPGRDYRLAIRPVPGSPTLAYGDPAILAPPFSPHVFIETAKGTIEFELAVLDSPQTANHFMGLARRGFFNGLPIHRVVPNFVVQGGDTRGDGEGGPGFTIRDELNARPFLRGTVGIALAWRDTGGSQFFITHSPQPHLDARYTAFGHVVNGMDVVDRIQQGDLIQRVRVWDGKTMQ